MKKLYPAIIILLILIAIQSCGKKTNPSRSTVNTDNRGEVSLVIKKNDSLVSIKPVIKRKPKEAIPKVIVVNDKFANKSVDGRFYYDLQGHRYWRNNKDGKYYLFNKSMLMDPAFKKPD